VETFASDHLAFNPRIQLCETNDSVLDDAQSAKRIRHRESLVSHPSGAD
jgi:hypothetical protein